MPFMTRDVVGQLLNAIVPGVTAVVLDGKYHPLVSVWDADVASDLHEWLANGKRRVMDVQEKHGVNWVDGELLTEDDAHKIFMNANTPDILERSWRG